MKDFQALTRVGRALRLRATVFSALDHYDLQAERLRLITNDTNGVFRLDTTDGRKLVVRVGLGGDIAHSAGQVAAETDWLAALASETDIDVPRPLLARDGRRFVTVEVPGVPDPRNVVVFSWLSGVLLDGRLSEENLIAYGALSAQLHQHGATHRPADPSALARYDRLIPFDEPLVLFDAGPDVLPPERRAVFEAARERVAEALDVLRVSSEPMRILHGDLHPWNVMVSRSGLAPFDFEDLMWGWPIQDIATSLWYQARKPEFAERTEAFRSGYETVSPWPERDGEMTAFLLGRYLVLGNDLLITPEWRGMASEYLERFEAGMRLLLGE